MTTVISVENRKGGVGKTTTAVTLAVRTAQKIAPEKVLLICVDPQGDAARALGLDPGGRCLSQLLREEASYGDVIMSADLAANGGPSRPNLYYLPASNRLFAALTTIQEDVVAMREIANKMTPQERKRKGLDEIDDLTARVLNILQPLKSTKNGPKYIFIDCPPSLGPMQMAIHKFADYAIVPVEPGDQDLAMTVQHTTEIAEDLKHGAKMKLLAVLPTNVQPQLNLHTAMLSQIRKVYEPQRALVTYIPRRTAIQQGPSLGGLVIFDHEPDSDAAKAYDVLSERVLAVGGR
ncbi:MAG: ParA family protein [Anaerolineae bacterium]|nr:ParA family protein [Anaerolineae bacterium]